MAVAQREVSVDSTVAIFYTFLCACGGEIEISSAPCRGKESTQLLKVRHNDKYVAEYPVTYDAIRAHDAPYHTQNIMALMAEEFFYGPEPRKVICPAAFEWGQATAVMRKLREGS